MAANVEHPYNYRKAVLHELAKPSSEAATPNLADITAQHAAGQGRIAVEDQALKSDTAFAEKKLAENNRQFLTKLDMDRQMLDTWGEQNKWATAIAVANLGIQAMGIPANRRQEEKQDAFLKDYKADTNKRIGMMETSAERQTAAILKQNAEQAARHDAVMDIANARSLVGDPESTQELIDQQNLTTEGTKALQAADRPHFPATSTPNFSLPEIARNYRIRLPH